MAIFIDRPSSLLAGIVVIAILHTTVKAIYNVFFHPLRCFPGPTSHAMFRLPYCYQLLRGTLPFDMLALHKRYGDIVRIAPNELAFSHPDAWKDIMGHQTSGGEEMGKWSNFYRPVPKLPDSIVIADRDEHSILRRQFSHGFSERSMRAQEPIIGQYIDLLIQRLHEKSQGGVAPLDMSAWYNFTTFDIIGDLAFGQPFGSLQNSRLHPFIPMLFKATKMGSMFLVLTFYPLIRSVLLALIPKSVGRVFDDHRRMAMSKIRQRAKLGDERKDLIEGLLEKKNGVDLDISRIEANASILLIGGSETTATLLAGVTYLLLRHPESLARLTKEVRSTFAREEDIDIQSVNNLTYMLACLNEALRMYPPVAVALPRVVPKNGRKILGNFIEEGTVVGVHHWASYHNEKYFTDPFGYHPERFLGDERFASDRLDILQPFHVGPRNCLGRNLAYTEMRLILARVVFNFDMRIDRESIGWMERQKVWFLWNKPPLHVYLTPVG